MQSETNQLAETGFVAKKLTLKVFGVGGGGGNAVDYMARQDFDGVSMMAINTDSKALSQLSTVERMTLGAKLTRGLGTGGDPEMGRAAAEEDLEKIRSLCAGADIVCVVAGLGGGTGTGAGPVVARLAKETGALVLGIVTLPFEFEGARRSRQAQLGLRDLKQEADGVICLPNQKVFKLIDQNTSVNEALKITNEVLAQGVRGIWRLLTQTGLINVDLNDLCAVLRGRHEESSLATVEASGENRSHEVIEKLMTHPFLEAGQSLAEADTVLVSLAGGPDMTMAEVNRVMEQINRQCENAHIIMGAGIQETCAGRLSVTLVASRQNGNVREREERQPARVPLQKDSTEAGHEQVHEMLNPTVAPRPASRYVPPAPSLTQQETHRLLTTQQGGGSRSRKKNSSMRQSTLALEIVSKGRFEKSEPTIIHGEDLDVPTYIRRGVALN
ncbi:MAG TPA: cell division protein FtsZ [Verrucomicrobiae bacterium]|jgi:cell division protein FtsZ|nr:cell division protein FtsZ [Verrucomicrobiae bacterium]